MASKPVITAQEIVCRCVLAEGPHTQTQFLLASYPTDNLIWSVGLLKREPLRRAYQDPATWSGDVTGWNKRSTREQGHI